MLETIIGLLVAITLSTSLLIETSSWCLRVYAVSGNIGIYIARTNIYLYGGRFFALLTQVLVSFLVDQGADSLVTLHIFLWGFIAATVIHVIFLGRKFTRSSLEAMLLRMMRLEMPKPQVVESNLNRRLFLATSAASTFFSLALMTPLVLASFFPDYRLTLNNAGSLINFLGMLVLLGYLDPMLYRALDDGLIAQKIESYIWGRATGFVLCVLILIGIFLA